MQLGKMLDAEKNTGVEKPFLGNRSVQWTKIDCTDLGLIKLSTAELPKYRLRDGDILVCEGGEVGRSAIWKQQLDECYFQKALHRLRPKNGYSPELFVNQMMRYSATGYLQNFVTQTSIAHLPKDKFETIQIPFAPQAEQAAIAVVLSDADALIESLELLLDKKRQIKQGAMQELLTGKRRLPGFSGKWASKRLGEIANVKTGSRNNQDKVEDGEYPFFVRSATIERINSYSHNCEAILIPGEGGIGSIFHYINGKFDVHQRVYAISQFSEQASGKFIHLYMSTNFGAHAMQNSVKATVDSLRLPTFLEFEINLPPTLPEQSAIAAVLSNMDTELEALEAKLEKARQVKQGMMQQLLTGKIRLVTPTAASSNAATATASQTNPGHTKVFNEAVIIAVLAKHFANEQFPLTRFRYTKLSYLLHRHVEREATGYLKKAAGPYDPSTRYGGSEKIAVQSRYARTFGKGFLAGDQIAKAEDYFQKWYGPEPLTWLEQFHYAKNNDLELLATVDMSCEDLRRAGKPATVEGVKQVIASAPAWLPKLDRSVFSDMAIAKAIQKCDALFGEAQR
jgi:type I restriction enzyme S subunit